VKLLRWLKIKILKLLTLTLDWSKLWQIIFVVQLIVGVEHGLNVRARASAVPHGVAIVPNAVVGCS